MNRSLRAAAFLLAALPLAGCYPWVVKDKHRLSFVAPKTVPQGGVFEFTVEAAGPDGEPVHQLRYGWMIDWPEVRGIRHTGVTFQPQRMEVKGGAGKAVLRLYMRDAAGHTTQTDRYEFTVE
jgi:hypothetical protein